MRRFQDSTLTASAALSIALLFLMLYVIHEKVTR